ncbi:MAG: hypothetical protein PHX87_06310 [Candidatus Peribacteraceae bacterium]|nr:hypothetical protein [Candidatus Peribacteraceae bacterium]
MFQLILMAKGILDRMAKILGLRALFNEVVARILALIFLIAFIYLMPYLLPPIFKTLLSITDIISKHPPAKIVIPQ